MLVLGGYGQRFVSEAIFQSYHLAAKVRQFRNELFQLVRMPCALLRILYIHCSPPSDKGQNKSRANSQLAISRNKKFTFPKSCRKNLGVRSRSRLSDKPRLIADGNLLPNCNKAFERF